MRGEYVRAVRGGELFGEGAIEFESGGRRAEGFAQVVPGGVDGDDEGGVREASGGDEGDGDSWRRWESYRGVGRGRRGSRERVEVFRSPV